MGKSQKLLEKLKRAITNRMVRNTFWLLLSRGSQLFIQSFYFVAITRSLGVEGYGGFMAVWALVWVLVPFSSWGWPNILVRNVSRDHKRFAESWGNALLVTSVLGCVCIGLILFLSRWLLPASLPLSLVFYVAVSQLLFDRLTTVSGRVFQAFQRLRVTATLGFLTRARNLVAVAVFITLGQTHDVVLWSQLYCVGGGVVMVLALAWVQWQFGSPKLKLGDIWQERLQGFYFAMGLSSQTIYNNVDKTMLARLSTLGATGMYAAGYRLVEISTTPIMALGGAAYARFFQKGGDGIQHSWSLAKKLMPIAAGYGLVMGVGWFWGAQYIPDILGEEYREVVPVVRMFAVIPLLRSLHFFPSDALTGAGYQKMRTALQMLTAVCNVLLNFWWIPLFSWRGAVASTLASDAVLAIGLLTTVSVLARREAIAAALVTQDQLSDLEHETKFEHEPNPRDLSLKR